MCGMTHLHVWHDSFTCVTWLTPQRYRRTQPPMTPKCRHSNNPFLWRAAAPPEWVMSHIWMHHVTHINESCNTDEWSCHTYDWVMSHMWLRHVTHMNESCHTHEWVMSHIWMSHVPRMDASCHTYECITSHIWLRSWHTDECVMSHIWISHATCKDESLLYAPDEVFTLNSTL